LATCLVKGVAKFCGDYYAIPDILQGLTKNALAVPASVNVRSIEERDSKLERPVNRSD
jgi:hypothetical protein